MKADFHDAHERHWRDAESLFTALRLANADHLYGISAECGLKTIMVKLGMPVDYSGSPSEKEHQVHINKLWDKFAAFVTGSPKSHYGAALGASNPFSDWHVGQRYAAQSGFMDARVRQHKSACSRIRSLIATAKADGLL
jgi:hypothetical protein